MHEALSVRPVRQRKALWWLTEGTSAGMARRKALLAYLFLLPTILGILVFTAGPVLFSLGLSLFSWDVISPPSFVGMANYQQFLVDPEGLKSFGNTAIYVVLDVTLQLVVGLILALAMQRKMRAWLRYLFRSAFFLPLIASGAAVSIVMGFLFNQDLGAVNYYLRLVHLPSIPWLTSASWAMVTVVLTSVWQQMGFTFLVFTGGLGTISADVLDAADVDGAGGVAPLVVCDTADVKPNHSLRGCGWGDRGPSGVHGALCADQRWTRRRHAHGGDDNLSGGVPEPANRLWIRSCGAAVWRDHGGDGGPVPPQQELGVLPVAGAHEREREGADALTDARGPCRSVAPATTIPRAEGDQTCAWAGAPVDRRLHRPGARVVDRYVVAALTGRVVFPAPAVAAAPSRLEQLSGCIQEDSLRHVCALSLHFLSGG